MTENEKKKLMNSVSVIIVGGGASGLMAGGFAAMHGARVVIFEKMPRVGRKLMITGKGRCNLANACDIQTFIQNVPVNGRFLYSAINGFPPTQIISFFEQLGLDTVTERGNRVFPKSQKAQDVVAAMYKFAINNGVDIVNKCVTDLIIEESVVKGVVAEDKSFYADSVIVATGGASYPLTGSTGDGYKLARQAGHTIIPIKPSLIPLESPDKCCKEMQGLSLKNVSLTVRDKNNKTLYTDFGEMLFTHFGISGPMVLSASAHLHNFNEDSYCAHIDLKPALGCEQLDLRIQRDFRDNINKAATNSLSKLLPKKMIPVVIDLWDIPADIKCNSITKQQRKKLVKILKDFKIKISGTRPIEEAIVTSGGVKVSQINPKTMESKLVKNLYFAGEVIDVDAYTGGFNLMIAWATGKLSGESAALNNM